MNLKKGLLVAVGCMFSLFVFMVGLPAQALAGVSTVNQPGSDGNCDFLGSDGNCDFLGSAGNCDFLGSEGNCDFLGSDGNCDF